MFLIQNVDSHKSKILYDAYHGSELPPLEDLPPAPELKFDFVSSGFTYEDFYKSFICVEMDHCQVLI